MSKDLLTKTEFPSKYRTKYIQKLLRNVYGLLKKELDAITINPNEELNSLKTTAKQEYTQIKNEYTIKLKNILISLKQIDNVLIAVTLASTLYIYNRQLLHKKSHQSLKIISADTVCYDTPEAFDVSINKIPFQVNLNCPVIIDDVLVPHMPIELKLSNFSCEINENEETITDVTTSPDLATYAIIKNKTDKNLFPSVSKDSFLTPELQIANLSGKVLYSPVNGYVDELSDQQIVLRDITDPTENFLDKQLTLLNEKYEKLNNIKSFLKYYYIGALYPIMLSVSIVDDSSTKDIRTGVDDEHKSIRKDFFKIDDHYEKQIKHITGKDNVEKHAKNETLEKIKEEIEKQEEIFYKQEKLLGKKAENISKITEAKNNEFNLFEFYALDLGAIFNRLENPTKIEIEFRDIINEFIRKRFIIDGYDKNKLEKKIDSAIKNIEKGVSAGNWFKKAMEVYKSKNKLSDLKNWLTGLANDNKKLNGIEKTYEVNKVMFLFEFYLNTDEIIKKYNVLKKETTDKKETVKEGNTIQEFTNKLWKDLDSLPKEINNIQKLIDSLAMFSTYSIIDYNGYQARLYTLSDESKCESKETDPYLNPKSKYGYGDIQYWLKYCSYATLASVTNPATGWSTGWIFPTPILFPIVYIPVKSIATKYGFIVIGLSICGIYIFPWSLFVNYSTSYTTPFGDPTTYIKQEIEALKKIISDGKKLLRTQYIKILADKVKIKIDDVNSELKEVEKLLTEHKTTKPPKYPKLNDNNVYEIGDIERGIQKNINYVDELSKWTILGAAYREQILTLKTKRWELTKIHKILTDASKSGKSIKGADKALEDSEKMINKQLDTLTALTDKIDKILAPLPISLTPETANFGITLKNPKPVIKIAEDLDDNINYTPLNKIFDKFKLKNDNMMSSKYGSQLSGTILDYRTYTKTLSASMMTIVKKDAFPSYELLKPTNVPWLSFLYKDFVTTGAKTYGFPGQIPLPLG